MNAIIKCLSERSNLVHPNTINTTNNASRNFLDSLVLYAIRARVDYYASQWTDAIANASVALSLSPLTDAAGFDSIFTIAADASPSSDVYWVIPSDGTLTPGGALNGNAASYRVSMNLSDTILAIGEAYVAPTVIQFNQPSIGGFMRTLIAKYNGVSSFKVFRAGEMMLIRAEAKFNSGDPTALDDLNNLSSHRNVMIGSETGPALLNAILLTRRIKLLGEGHRWFDLKRTSRTINRVECGSAGFSSSSNCEI